MPNDAGPQLSPVKGQQNTSRVTIAELTGGLSTRAFPTLIPGNYLTVANNVRYYSDGLISKRPGNQNFGSGNGAIGTGLPSQSGTRFYPASTVAASAAPQLIVQSNGKLYRGNDITGTFTQVASAFTFSNNCNYTQMFDPVTQQIQLFVVDGAHVPVMVNAAGVGTQVSTGFGVGTNAFLPANPLGNPITPAYLCEFQYHLVYAGEPTDPTAIYISDALNPQNFNGYSITDTQAVNYTQYYPGGRGGKYGVITGIATVGQSLLIFFTNGIISMQNSGVYSATQYTFNVLSPSIGLKSPRSLIFMDYFVSWFGGDKFYATDGINFLSPIPDELPTVYSNTSTSAFPPLIKNNTTVMGDRRESQMIWTYDSTGGGIIDSNVVFDMSAQGGWSPGNNKGGAWAMWSGMPMEWAVECRGPGDNFQLFWGSSIADKIAQHDYVATIGASGGCSDFGQPISMEVRTKAFLFDIPANPKTVQSMYIMCAFNALSMEYGVSIQPYIFFDNFQVLTVNQAQFNVPSVGAIYGTGPVYGTGVLYESESLSFQQTSKASMPGISQGLSVAPGIIETSIWPVNLYGFVVELTVEPVI